jgi:microcystin-dependent protein
VPSEASLKYPVPVGTVLAWASDPKKSALPAGFLLCDGKAVDRNKYSDLFDVIGDFWGDGDNVTTFNLPDMCGLFMRGVSGNTGNDPDSATRVDYRNRNTVVGDRVGSYQADALISHGHALSNSVSANTGDVNDNTKNVTAVNRYGLIQPVTAVPFGGAETRPRNASVNFIVKF